jgi:hypothetical protein
MKKIPNLSYRKSKLIGFNLKIIIFYSFIFIGLFSLNFFVGYNINNNTYIVSYALAQTEKVKVKVNDSIGKDEESKGTSSSDVKDLTTITVQIDKNNVR